MGAPRESTARREIRRLVHFYYYEGESDWKVRPYLNYLQSGKVSPAVAEKLQQLRELGNIVFEGAKGKRFAEFAVPRDCPLDALLKIDGIGPRTAVRLCVDNRVRSLADLEHAILPTSVRTALAVSNRVARRIPRKSIAAVRRQIARLLQTPFEVAGSYRRGAITCSDVDLVVQTGREFPTLQSVLQALDPLLEADLTSRNTRTKYSGHLRAGRTDRLFRIDIRAVPPESFATALLYFTGSAAFNVKMRSHAKELGFRLNEYGLWKGTRSIPTPTERAVFAALQLPYVPPTKR